MTLSEILFKRIDVFDLKGTQRAARRKEREILRELKETRGQEVALLAAQASGETVQTEIDRLRAKAKTLMDSIPRGDVRELRRLSFLSLLFLIALTVVYRCGTDLIVEIWGPMENWSDSWYLQKYRQPAADIWLVTQPLVSRYLHIPALAAIWVVVWLTQRRLQGRHARLLIWFVAGVLILGFLVLHFAPSHLVLSPLMMAT